MDNVLVPLLLLGCLGGTGCGPLGGVYGGRGCGSCGCGWDGGCGNWGWGRGGFNNCCPGCGCYYSRCCDGRMRRFCRRVVTTTSCCRW